MNKVIEAILKAKQFMRGNSANKKYNEESCKSLNRIAGACDTYCSDNCNMECPFGFKED